MLSQTSILWINKNIWSEWLYNTIKIDFLRVIEISKEKKLSFIDINLSWSNTK
jgi:hypothetical protein